MRCSEHEIAQPNPSGLLLANLRQHVTSVLSHVELRVQPQPVFAMASGESEKAMAEKARATGTTGRAAALPPRTQRLPASGNGADRNEPRPVAPPAARGPAPRATPPAPAAHVSAF